MREVQPEIEKIYFTCSRVLSAFGGLEFDTFSETDSVFGTTFWHIISLSEICKRLPPETKALVPDLPWKEMEAWGDELIKNSPDVDMQWAWQIANTRVQDVYDKLMLYIYGNEYYEKQLKARATDSWFIR